MWQPQGLYNQFVLKIPVILKGEEAVRGLYNFPCERIAVIHEPFFKDQALFKSVFKKKEVRFFVRSWNGEPDLAGLSGTLSEIEVFHPDTFIAVGGGSVMDGTKLCRLFYELPYYTPGGRIDGSALKTKFIAIPTTVGSGAEVSSAAIFVKDHHKEMIVLHEFQPDAVVFDERYVRETPEKILYASGLDAMSHLIEGYVSKNENSMTDVLAEKGLEIVRNGLEHLIKKEGVDFFRFQYGGFLGGIVQNHCVVGAAHGVAHQLTELGYSHGEAVGLLLAASIKENMKDEITRNKYEVLAKKSGFENTENLIAFIEKVCMVSGIGSRKAELKEILLKKEEDAAFMDNIRNDRGGKGNPIEMTDGYLKQLFRSV